MLQDFPNREPRNTTARFPKRSRRGRLSVARPWRSGRTVKLSYWPPGTYGTKPLRQAFFEFGEVVVFQAENTTSPKVGLGEVVFFKWKTGCREKANRGGAATTPKEW